MLADFYGWFIALPIYFQALGYLLLLPFALMALGFMVLFVDNTAAQSFEGTNIVVGLIFLGMLAAALLGPIFGMTALFYYVVHLPYWLSVLIGFVTGPLLLMTVLYFIGNRRP